MKLHKKEEPIKITLSIKDVGKPRFTGWTGGYGIHKSKKHPDRAKRKADFRKSIKREDY